MVYVGHNAHQMQAACERGIVLERGQVAFEGSIVDALDRYCNTPTAPAVTKAPLPADPVTKAPLPSDRQPPGHPNARLMEVIASRVSYHPISSDYNMGSAIIDLTICANEVIPDVRLVSAIFSATQPHPLIFTLSDTISLSPGTHRITLKIPSLRMLPDDYVMKLTLIDDSSTFPLWTKGWQDAPLPFCVSGEPNRFSNLTRLASARVELGCEISVEEITPVECENELIL